MNRISTLSSAGQSAQHCVLLAQNAALDWMPCLVHLCNANKSHRHLCGGYCNECDAQPSSMKLHLSVMIHSRTITRGHSMSMMVKARCSHITQTSSHSKRLKLAVGRTGLLHMSMLLSHKVPTAKGLLKHNGSAHQPLLCFHLAIPARQQPCCSLE